MKSVALAWGLIASLAVGSWATSPVYGQRALPHNVQRLPNGRIATPSNAALYRLRSMGHHVVLSPALRWRLGRAPYTRSSLPTQPNTTTTRLSAPGASAYYPATNRAQPRKPFADVRPEPTGFERYWPLLLEGREDPKTGLIIWELP